MPKVVQLQIKAFDGQGEFVSHARTQIFGLMSSREICVENLTTQM